MVRGGAPWWRKNYRGSAASQLWRVDGDRWTQLTSNRGRDQWPLVTADGADLLWVSERDGTDNLWTRPVSGGTPRQLTHFDDDGVRYPTISADGKTVVFERGVDLYRLKWRRSKAKPQRIEITLHDDAGEEPSARRRVRSASESVPSPDGKSLAFIARGELYVRRIESGVPVRLTDTPAREGQPEWAPDGKSIYFVSDRTGEHDIYRVKAADGEDPRLHRALRFEIDTVISSPQPDRAPTLSPDGKQLAWIRGSGELWLRDLKPADAEPRQLLSGWDAPRFSFSPDGRWLAFSRENDDFNSDVFLLEIETGRQINVSQHPDSDYSPAWSPDGRKLAFIGRRHGQDHEVYLVWLRREDEEKTSQDLADEKEDAQGKKKPTSSSSPPKPPAPEKKTAEAESPDKEKPAPKPKLKVQVDEKDIWRRVHQVKALLGEQTWVGFSSNSEQLVFQSNHLGTSDLFSCKLNGSSLKRLTTGQSPSGPQVHSRSKSIFFRRSGSTPARVTISSAKVSSWSVDVRIEHPRRAERAQVFTEAWRTMRDRWYDGNFKGKDWNAIRTKYADLAASRRTHREFQTVISFMLGELNGSHLGISGGDDAVSGGSAPETGQLGVQLEPGQAGWEVVDVLPRGPADRETSRLQKGDRILAIDGQSLKASDILARHLSGTVGRKIALDIQRATTEDGEQEERQRVIIRPTSSGTIRGLSYERFIDDSVTQVTRSSSGRLGYLHVRSMNASSLQRFETELFARAHGREGLVIDVRFNGGGWTADYLMAILNAPAHAFTIPRGGGRGYPQGRRPLAAWNKPVVVLCNERSFSNAEIFSHAIKTTRRGKVVGRETFGGVISTGSRTLLDGSRLRVPFRGWYVLGSGQDMDRVGAIPDIAVDNLPGETRDRQLEAAVDSLLQDLAY